MVGAAIKLQQHYSVNRIMGISAGAMLGAGIAAGVSPDTQVRLGLETDIPALFTKRSGKRMRTGGVFSPQPVINWVEEMLSGTGKETFADLEPPTIASGGTSGGSRLVVRANAFEIDLRRLRSNFGLFATSVAVISGRQKSFIPIDFPEGIKRIIPNSSHESIRLSDAVGFSLRIPMLFEPGVARDPDTGRVFMIVDGAYKDALPRDVMLPSRRCISTRFLRMRWRTPRTWFPRSDCRCVTKTTTRWRNVGATKPSIPTR